MIRVFGEGGPGSGNFGHAGRPGKVGGSAPKGLSRKGGARTKRPSRTYEWGVNMAEYVESKWIKAGARDREAGQIIDKEGNIHWETEDSGFADTISVPDGVELKSAIFTHYHPPIQYEGGKKKHGVENGVSQPLGPSDVRWAVRNNLKEIRSVGTYRGRPIVTRLVRTGRGWPKSFRYFLGERSVMSHLEGYREGMESSDEADLTALSFEAFHDYWGEAAAYSKGVEYEAYEPY